MLENIEAVIFDLDGTLADSMWVWTSIDDAYIEKYCLEIPDGFYKEIEGKSFTETAEQFLDAFPQIHLTVDEIKQEWNRAAFEKYTKEVKIKEGAREFLLELQKRHIPAGIASSNSRELISAFLEANQIRELFSSVRTSCEVHAGKPAPDVYLKVAEDLGANPNRCLVFEDVPKGILAGKNAGMKVCAVEDDFSAPQMEKKRELADYFIRNYFDIQNKTYEVL